MNKKGVIIITVLFLVLVLGIFLFVKNSNNEKELCVLVETTCCPCNMGGVQKCVLESEKDKHEINKAECSEPQMCAAFYNCDITSCDYVEGECIAR